MSSSRPSSFLIAGTSYPTLPLISDLNQSQGPPYMDNADPCLFHQSILMTANFYYLPLSLLRSTLSENPTADITQSIHRVVPLAWFTTLPIDLPLTSLSAHLGTIAFHLNNCLYFILYSILSYLLFASLCTRVSLSSLSFSLIRSLVSAISRSSLVTNIFNDQTMGTDSPVCSPGITIISPGVNALRLHGWRHSLLFYLFLVLFFHSASQPFSWCWCGPDSRTDSSSLVLIPLSSFPYPPYSISKLSSFISLHFLTSL